jgi:anti-anti-sigma regulatory factor
MLDAQREGATGAIVLSLSGALDSAAAAALLSAVTQVPAPVAVVLELSHVHEFHDSAMGILADQLGRRAGPVAFRGLRRHQERVLNYLGMKTDEHGLLLAHATRLAGSCPVETTQSL